MKMEHLSLNDLEGMFEKREFENPHFSECDSCKTAWDTYLKFSSQNYMNRADLKRFASFLEGHKEEDFEGTAREVFKIVYSEIYG